MILPETVQEHLSTFFIRSAFPAYLFVSKDGYLMEWGGYCERYGLDGLLKGQPAVDQLDFLTGMLPLDGHWFKLSHMHIHQYRMVDIHFIPGEEGDWVVLLDCTEQAERDARLQQQANDIQLLEYKQRQMLQKLHKSNDNLLAVLNQLNLTIAIISVSGEISFISHSGLKLLNADYDSVIGRHWRNQFPFSDDDAQAFEKLLENPQENGNRLKVKLKLEHVENSGNEKWLEVDVRQDPRDPQMRIAYFYDISELLDLRNMLKQKSRFQNMVGRSQIMHRVFERIKAVANFDTTVLIEGETGTGKELAARAIHFSSPRKEGPFIVVNCAGLADSLINSQLFGHKKGSFTDAVSDQKGVFEAADGGTIVLDEIGDIPMNTQTRILRALEQREIIRVGETRARKVNIRIVAATNKNLEEEVKKGNFRLDLLYRIKIARVQLPPLRERREDIAPLVNAFINEICLENGMDTVQIERAALSALMVYKWPGNIRELRNAVEFAIINCRDSVIRLADFPDEVKGAKLQRANNKDTDAEKHQIIEALKACDNRRDEAAKLLGISRATLYRKLKTYCLNDHTL